MRENHYAISCISLKISYVFTYKINITFLFFLMSWKELPLSECKISYFIDVLHYIERIYSLNPLLFLGSSVDCRKPCRSFSHCSLNHSPIGCLFMVSSNLFSSTVIVKTCSDRLFSIGQKNCQLFVAKLRNFLDSHNRMVLY